MEQRRLFIFGLGYLGQAVARAALAAGWSVAGTHRAPPPDAAAPDDPACLLSGIVRYRFDSREHVLREGLRHATHLLVSIPPDTQSDAALELYGAAIAGAAPPAEGPDGAANLRWVGYYSTTGVYGDRDGAVATEETPPRPTQPRSVARLGAETRWQDIARRAGVSCDIMRLGGIYGPGRSPFDRLRAGTASMIAAPDHLFSRIHRDDAVGATLAAMTSSDSAQVGRTRVLNFVDSLPATQEAVIRHAAALLHLPAPPAVPLADARPKMSAMAASFWSERRVVHSTLTEAWIGRRWRYPDYRAGLEALLRAEALSGGDAQSG